MTNPMKPRSYEVTDGFERAPARAMLRAVGMTDDDWGRSQIGVASSWNEVTPCNLPLDRLAKRAKVGVRDAGGFPIEFVTLAENRVLVVLVFNDREVQNRIIQLERHFSPDELKRASNFLNDQFRGRGLAQARQEILRQLSETQAHLNQVMLDAISVAQHVFESGEEAVEPAAFGFAWNDGRPVFAALGFMGGAAFPVGLLLLVGLLNPRYRFSDEASGPFSGLTLLGILTNPQKALLAYLVALLFWPRLALGGRTSMQHVGVHAHRAEAAHTDAPVAKGDRQPLGEGDGRVFGDRVRSRPDLGQQSRRGCRCEEIATSTL